MLRRGVVRRLYRHARLRVRAYAELIAWLRRAARGEEWM